MEKCQDGFIGLAFKAHVLQRTHALPPISLYIATGKAVPGMAPSGQSFFQIVNGLRHYGVGARLTRSIWHGEPGTYWDVKRVVLKQGDPRHGKAWGVFFWKGEQKGGEQKIRGPLKKQWSLLECGGKGEGAIGTDADGSKQALQ